QRPDVTHVDMADRNAPLAGAANRLVDRAESAAPSDNGEMAGGVAQSYLLVRHDDTIDLRFASVGHRLVVRRRIVDVAGLDVLFDPADAVHQARRAGLDPGARALLVAAVGKQRIAPL